MATDFSTFNFCSVLTLIVIVLGVYFIFQSVQKEGLREAQRVERFYYNVNDGYTFNPCYSETSVRGCGKCSY
jgi:hypothetical protein